MRLSVVGLVRPALIPCRATRPCCHKRAAIAGFLKATAFLTFRSLRVLAKSPSPMGYCPGSGARGRTRCDSISRVHELQPPRYRMGEVAAQGVGSLPHR